MEKKIVILICFGLFSTINLLGQCPDKDSMWKRLIFLRDSPAIAPAPEKQLIELLKYEVLIKDCNYHFDSTHALLLQRIGVLYSRQANYVKAIKYVQQSINVITANTGKPSVNIKYLIRSYYILSELYNDLGRVAERMDAIDNCVKVALQLKWADPYTLYPLGERVEYLYDMGDYQRSFDYAVTGESIVKEHLHDQDSIRYIVIFLTWKVNALLTLENFDLAEQLLANKIEECNRIGARQYLGIIYEQLGEVQVGKKNYDKAQLYFQMAFQHNFELGNTYACSQILNNLGYSVYFKEYKDFYKAINTYKMSIRVLNKNKYQHGSEALELLNLFGNIGYAFACLGNYDSAFAYFQHAFDKIKPGMSEKNVLDGSLIDTIQYKRIRFLVSLIIEKADTYIIRFKETKDPKDLQEALLIYKLTDQFLDKIRGRQSEIQSKLFWRADNRHLYENAIEACFLSNIYKDAFYFFEKSRAVLLNDQLNEQRWLKEEDILRQAQLKRNILLRQREFDNTDKSSSRHKELQTEIFNLNLELNQLDKNMKEKTPSYFLSLRDTNVVSIRDIQQKLLQNHEALIELFAGDSAVFALIITQNQDKLIRIEKPAFDSLSHLYITYISDKFLLNRHFDDFKKISLRLYQLIFQNNIIPPGRIIISPDGRYFPFETLVINNDNPQPDYFLADHAVSYTYSARYLMNDFISTAAAAHPGNFMGVAPVNYSFNPQLSSLNGSNISLGKIGKYFSGTYNLVSELATKNNFSQHFSDYKIVQLYTHASDSSERKEPVIYFADSALYLSELMPEKKPFTQLIVLSACETGNGVNYQGEGVFSFNRAFAALGVPSSVTNLWSVDNIATYKLTELFYKYLSQNLPMDIALQKAKLEYINSAEGENRLPYYWAAPILVGKTDPIALDKPFAWKYLLAGIGVAGLAFFGLYKLRRKKFVRALA